MKLSSFSRFLNHLGLRRAERKPQRRGKHRPAQKPTLEFLEDRTLMSTTPAAVVTNPNTSPYYLAQGFSPTSGYDPQVVMDPTNSQNLVEVNTTGSGLTGQFSTDGGQSWTTFAFSTNYLGASAGAVYDPTTFFNGTPTGEVVYPNVTSPSVTFDRNENIYVVSNQFNANAQTLASSAADLANGTDVPGASGAIVFDKFSFTALVARSNNAETIKNTILYQWHGQDPAYNPTVAVDTNLPATLASGPSFTDPTTGANQTDTMAVMIDPTTGAAVAPGTAGAVPKGIYVGWNINFTEPQFRGNIPPAVSRIMIAASGDGGANFTTNQYADISAAGVGAAPQFLFTQGTTVPAATTTITFLTAATTAAAGQLSGTITIQVNNVGGTPVAGQVVDLTSSSSTGAFYTVSGAPVPTTPSGIPYVITNGAGQASFQYEDATAGTPTIKAADAATTTLFAQQTETVTADVADTITFATPAMTVTAGRQSGTITLQVNDASGNPIPNKVVDLSSSFLSGTFYTLAGAALPTTAAGVPYVVTNGAGQASFLYEDTTVGTPTLTASDAANPNVIGQQTETITASTVATITFTTFATTTDAGQQSGTINIRVRNAGNVAVSGEVVDLTSNSATGTFYTVAGVPLPKTAGGVSYVITNGAGQASFLYMDTAAGSPTLKAADSGSAVFAQQTETINAGVAATITYTTPVTTTDAGEQSGTITIQVVDAGALPVANEVVKLGSSSGTGTFYSLAGTALPTTAAGAPYVVTNGAGQASFLYEDTTVGAPVLTATDTAKPAVFVQQTETVNAGVAASITFTTAATTTDAGQQAGPITIQVVDAGAAPVPGEMVDLTSSTGTGTFYDSTGAPLPTTAGVPFVFTNGAGQASFLYMDTNAGSPVLTATDAANPLVFGQQTETVNPGAGITFVTPPTTVTAGKQSSAITIKFTDDNNAAVPNHLVDLTSNSATGTFYNSATGAALPKTPNGFAYVITDSSGDASFLYVDTNPGTPTLTATDAATNSVSKTQQETITAGAAATITFTTAAVTTTAGRQSGTITIQVKNAGNVAVSGEVVDLSSNFGNGTFYTVAGAPLPKTAGGAPYVITNGSGQASFLYEQTSPGSPVLTARDSAKFAVSGQQTETINNDEAATLTFLTLPTTAAPGQEAGPITVQLKNGSNAAIPGELLTLATNSTTGTFYDATGAVITSVFTNGAGDASFFYVDLVPSTPTLTVTDPSTITLFATQTETVTSAGVPTVPGGQLNVVYTNDGGSAPIQQSQPDGGVATNDVAAAVTFNATFANSNIADGNPAGFATETVFVVGNGTNGNGGISNTDFQMQVTIPGGTLLPPVGSIVTIDANTANQEQVQVVSEFGSIWGIKTAAGAARTAANAQNHANGAPVTYQVQTAAATSQATNFQLTVTAANFPSDFTTIDDLEVTVAMVHPHMDQVSLVLIPPPGSGLASITLLRNFLNTNGTTNTFQGLPDLPNLGVLANPTVRPNEANTVGTVFDSDAPRAINTEDDNTSTAPWIGHFRPEAGSLNEVDNLTAAQVAGQWTLQVTDFVNDGTNPGPDQFMTEFSMHFTSLISTTGFGAGADTTTGGGGPGGATGDPAYTEHGASQTAGLGALTGSPSNVYPTNLGGPAPNFASGTPGAGSGIVAAIDNTLGSFSPFAGRIYLAYSTGTTVNVAHSDNDAVRFGAGVQVNDDSITDNFSEGNRPEFMPSITVDPVTGTLVVMYYDGRWDAATSRVGNSISYSVDGGEDWSASASMNLEQTATDEVTGNNVNVSPVVGNTTAAGTFGFGDRQSLVAYDGDVMPFFSSNLNAGGSSIMTADVSIPTGPRVVTGDMGPVVTDFNYTPTVYKDSANTGGAAYVPVTYNNVFAPDGSRELDQFVVTFDRPIDISTFTTSQIQVFFRDPEGDAAVAIAVQSIRALDNTTQFGPDRVGLVSGVYTLATQFLITLIAPQSAVGTYSYAIGLNPTLPTISGDVLLSDDIRSIPTGIALLHAGQTETTAGQNGGSTVLLGTYMNQNQNALTNVNPVVGVNTTTPIESTDTTPPALPVGTPVSDTITISDAYQQVRQDFYDPIQVRVDIGAQTSVRLAVSLVSADGTTINLGTAIFVPTNGVATVIFADYNPTGSALVQTPANPLFAKLLNEGVSGTWTLKLTNQTGGTTPVLNDWLLSVPRTTNAFAVPNPVNGMPFNFPYSDNTLPLIVAGPHVVSTAVVSTGTYNTVSTYNTIGATQNNIAVNLAAGASTTADQLLLPVTDTVNVVNTSDAAAASNAYQIQQDGTNHIEAHVDLTNAVGKNLTIKLVAQDGNTVTLISGVLASNSYTFDDFAPAGTNSPATPLAALVNDNTAGDWQLVVTNNGGAAAAFTVADWSLQLPHTTGDNEVLNGQATGILVTFDRDITASTFTSADVVQMLDPLGQPIGGSPVPTASNFSVIADPAGTPAALAKRVFEVTFPTEVLNGTYSLTLAPTIQDTNGNAIDTNFNAGIDVLNGTNSTNSVTTALNASTIGNLNLLLPPGQTVTSDITVTQAFEILQDNPLVTSTFTQAQQLQHHIQVAVNIQAANGSSIESSDFQAQLVAPDGTTIQLFTNVGQPNAPTQGFASTTFDDFATTPIQQGVPPYSNLTGTFNPQEPLSVLVGKNTSGNWHLVITNTSTNGDIGALEDWTLQLPHATPDTNLGEVQADQISTSFRIFTQDPSNPLTKQQWTAVGPAADNNSANSGPVNAIAVDPSDPSGNTVYVAAASGGLWKTTNFLTTNPLGPTYVPLTNLGPTGSLNISSIAVYAVNNNPTESYIYAITGNPNNPTIPGNVGATQGTVTETWTLAQPLNAGATDLFIGAETFTPPGAPFNVTFADGQVVTVTNTDVNGNNLEWALAAPAATTEAAGKVLTYSSVVGGPVDLSAGIGLIRSDDGGQTWEVLDSSHNFFDPANDGSGGPGNTSVDDQPLPESSTGRDHFFVGLVGTKVTVDPTPLPNGNIVVYAAFSNGPNNTNGGLYRSVDGGADWTLQPAFDAVTGKTDLFSGTATAVMAGNATDVVLAAGSGDVNHNLQQLYAAFSSVPGNIGGVYGTTSATSALSLGSAPLASGSPGQLPSLQNVDNGFRFPQTVTIANSPTPNGNNGRIVLATPTLTSSPLENSFYEGWIYAAVANNANTGLVGLYVSKDFGLNWTQVQLPEVTTAQPVFGTNNTTRADINTLLDPNSQFASNVGLNDQVTGVASLSLTIDPTNPNIVYLGGGGYNLLRVDITNLADAYAAVPYTNVAPDGGTTEFASTGRATLNGPGGTFGVFDTLTPNQPLTNPATYPIEQGPSGSTGYYNLLRDPLNPFPGATPASTVQLKNIITIQNQGTGVLWGELGNLTNSLGVGILGNMPDPIAGNANAKLTNSIDIRALVAIRDPLTGETRLLVGDDNGVFTGADRSSTQLQDNVGTADEVIGSRNGNIQIADMADSTAQPSSLAANIAGALFYGQSQFNNGFPTSTANILDTGNLNWTGLNTAPSSNAPSFFGNGTAVATDQTGSGQLYQYRWAQLNGNGINQAPNPFTNFFLVTPPQGALTGRTFGTNPTNQAQWPSQGGSSFAVNPVDPTGIVMSSQSGAVYRTFGPVNNGGTGITWHQIGNFTASYGDALAFGAPNPSVDTNNDDFIYDGTVGGQVWVTFNGGQTSWTNITANLDGSAVEQIVTDPHQGTHDVYVVTQLGVYYMADSTGQTSAITWKNITGNLFSLSRSIFDNPHNPNDQQVTLKDLTSLAVDWRFAIPTNPALPVSATNPTFPVLYAGGDGGVFRSQDDGATWSFFPQVSDSWTLASPVTAGATTINVNAGGPTPQAGPFKITIGSEQLTVTNTTNTWTLASPLAANAMTLTVTGGPAVPTTPFTVTIDSEQLVISSTSGTTWTIMQRGANGTAAVTHLNAATVTNNTLWTVTRGVNGTTAAAHTPSANDVTNNGDAAVEEGGNLPNMQVTSLQLVNGNINPLTGLPNEGTGYNLLMASTYGQGDFVIRLDNSAVQQYAISIVSFAGPSVTSVTPVPATGGTVLTAVTVTFGTTIPVDPQTVKPADMTLFDPNGNVVAVASVVDVTPNPSNGSNPHNVYQFNLLHPQTLIGSYTVRVTGATDNAGDLMTPYAGAFTFPFSSTEVAASFPNFGIYGYRSTTGFQPLLGSTATILAVNANGDVAAELSGNGGVWRYTQANQTWQELTGANASALAIDKNGDVVADLAGQGVYLYHSATGAFSHISTFNASLLAMDDAGDVFANFAANSGFPAPGVNKFASGAISWTNLNGTQATLLAADGAGDLFINFVGYGVDKYTASNGGFSSLNGTNALLLTADAAGDAAVVFQGYSGIYEATANATGFNTQITAAATSELAMGGAGDVFAVLSDNNVWEIMNDGASNRQLTVPTTSVSLPGQDQAGDLFGLVSGSGIMRNTIAAGWQLLPPIATPSILAVDAAGDVVGEFPNYGVYLYTKASGAWNHLTAANASVLGIDAAGDVYADLANQGVYRYTSAGGWSQIATSNATLLAVDANGDAAANFPGAGIWRYTISTGFRQVNGNSATLLAIDAAGDIYANLTSFGVYRFLNNGGGQAINGTTATQLTVDAAGDLFVTFKNVGGTYRSSFANPTAFQQVAASAAAVLSNDIEGDVFLDFPGYAYFEYTTANGLLLLPGTEGKPTVLA